MDCLACYVAGVSKCLSVRKDQVFLLQRLNCLYCNGCMLVNKSPTVMCLATPPPPPPKTNKPEQQQKALLCGQADTNLT